MEAKRQLFVTKPLHEGGDSHYKLVVKIGNDFRPYYGFGGRKTKYSGKNNLRDFPQYFKPENEISYLKEFYEREYEHQCTWAAICTSDYSKSLGRGRIIEVLKQSSTEPRTYIFKIAIPLYSGKWHYIYNDNSSNCIDTETGEIYYYKAMYYLIVAVRNWKLSQKQRTWQDHAQFYASIVPISIYQQAPKVGWLDMVSEKPYYEKTRAVMKSYETALQIYGFSDY